MLPYSARNIAEAAEKCGRYDLAVSPLRNGFVFSRSVYDLCRFWCEKGVLYGSPSMSLTMFGNALVDAYRSTGDTENMLKTMQELYNFVRDDVNSSDKDIASAANDIAWEYFTCG